MPALVDGLVKLAAVTDKTLWVVWPGPVPTVLKEVYDILAI